jgi:hypothetical protein
MVLIHADDETRRIRLLLLPQSRQLLVRIRNHGTQPTFLKQCRLQAFALALEGEAIFKRRPVFAPLREPAQLAFIAREENRTAHPVPKRVRIAVHEVRPTLALFVPDKGDGMIVRAKGCP